MLLQPYLLQVMHVYNISIPDSFMYTCYRMLKHIGWLFSELKLSDNLLIIYAETNREASLVPRLLRSHWKYTYTATCLLSSLIHGHSLFCTADIMIHNWIRILKWKTVRMVYEGVTVLSLLVSVWSMWSYSGWSWLQRIWQSWDSALQRVHKWSV